VARRKALDADAQIHVFELDRRAADITVSVDAFEHFGDPAEILQIMSKLPAPQAKYSWVSSQPSIGPWAGICFPCFPGHT